MKKNKKLLIISIFAIIFIVAFYAILNTGVLQNNKENNVNNNENNISEIDDMQAYYESGLYENLSDDKKKEADSIIKKMYSYLDEKYEGKYTFNQVKFWSDPEGMQDRLELSVNGYNEDKTFTVYCFKNGDEPRYEDDLINIIKEPEYKEALEKAIKEELKKDDFKVIVEELMIREMYNDVIESEEGMPETDILAESSANICIYVNSKSYDLESYKSFIIDVINLIKTKTDGRESVRIESYLVKEDEFDNINEENYFKKNTENIFLSNEFYDTMFNLEEMDIKNEISLIESDNKSAE